MKNAFHFILKALFVLEIFKFVYCLPFFSLSAIGLEDDQRKILKFMMSCQSFNVVLISQDIKQNMTLKLCQLIEY